MVVSSFFLCSSLKLGKIPILTTYFSDGLKPPTSVDSLFILSYFWCSGNSIDVWGPTYEIPERHTQCPHEFTLFWYEQNAAGLFKVCRSHEGFAFFRIHGFEPSSNLWVFLLKLRHHLIRLWVRIQDFPLKNRWSQKLWKTSGPALGLIGVILKVNVSEK